MSTSNDIFIVVWSGGYEAPSYVVKRTEAEAWAQAKEWLAEADEEGDWIDVLHLDLTTLILRRLEDKENT